MAPRSMGKRTRLAALAGMIVAMLAGAGYARPAIAQSAASAFTSATRYNIDRQVVGTIAPDPDGAGSIAFAAVRNSYDAAGRLVKIEKGELAAWQSEAVDPASWTGFTIFRTADTTYDVMSRKIKETVSAGGAIYSVTQYGYDSFGRPDCTAVRMNPAIFGSPPANACSLGTEGAQGPDRITKNVYDAAGQLLKVQKAYGTALQQDYVTYSYTPNGKQASVIDANGNKAAYGYDAFDRQILWAFPSTTVPGAASTTDFEQYTYDANGNRTSLRKRDGRSITYSYDALNRVTVKDVSGACVSGYACTTPPASAVRDVYYDFDLRGLQTAARFDSASGTDRVANGYDGFGRLSSSTTAMGGTSRTLGYLYDADGNRIRVTHPGGTYFTYDYDGLDRAIAVRENGSTQVASIGYDAQGRRVGTARGAVLTTYGYDTVSRLTSLTDDLSGTIADVTATFAYNPASQMISRTRSNDSYAFSGYATASNSYTANALNQYTAVGAGSLGYDSNGNLASNGGTSFTYDVENRLVAAAGTLATAMTYDANGRLFQTVGASGTRQFLYDGDELVVEYDGVGNLLRRYVHGPAEDDPLLWYEGAGLTDRRSLQSDHQGSIVSVGDASGALIAINAYDEYGVPAASNIGTFQYTGQAWLPDLGMYYYKARIYSSRLGRFLQTDPIGYKDQVNLYAYVTNDPINNVDPDGEEFIAAGIGAFVGTIGGLVVQAADDVTSGHFSGADSYAAAALGGAAGGAVFGLTGNATLAGATAGGVTEGTKALMRGEGVRVAIRKGAVGAGLGAVGGRLGARLSASGGGIVGRAIQRTSTGRAIARNERMSNMMRGRLQHGNVRNPSMATVYKMTGASVTSGAASAKITSAVTNAANQEINKSCGAGEKCQ